MHLSWCKFSLSVGVDWRKAVEMKGEERHFAARNNKTGLQ